MEQIKSLQDDLNNWTLSSDQKLLEALQAVSKIVDETASKYCDDVDSLGFLVKDAEIGLRNVFNEFLLLGNTQFIENVSYDTSELQCIPS